MTELVSLYRKAEQLNIPIYHLPLPQTGSMSVMDEGGRCAIGMDLPSRHTETEQRVRLAHELGHCVTGSFYNRYSPCDVRKLHENRADKYAIETLIPVEALDAAIAGGVTERCELAEYFGVDEAFLKKALCWYVHGNLAAELYF